MDKARLVRRSLGVPDVVDDANVAEAMRYRLAVAAGLDISADPNTSYETQRRLSDAEKVATRAMELVISGELDGAIAGFGHRDDDWHVSRLLRSLDLDVYEHGSACARAVLERLRAYVTNHPFEDGNGSPFR